MHRVFLWHPKDMFKFKFKCQNCPEFLHNKGLHNRVRTVLDIKDYYLLITELLGCNCGKTYVATDSRILEQLPADLLLKFPAVLTSKYACDRAIVSLVKSRTLGNSPHSLRNTLHEMHSEHWMKLGLEYMGSCKAQINFDKKDSEDKLWKLSGNAQRTATWVTNVSNSYGGILQFALPQSKSSPVFITDLAAQHQVSIRLPTQSSRPV